MKLFTGFALMMLSFASFANVVVGTVDVQKVLVSIKEGKGVIKELEKNFNEKKAKLKGEEDKIKKLQDEYQKQNMVLSDAAKAKKERDIQEMIAKLQQQTMDYQKEIQDLENKLKKPILDKLKGIIDDVSTKAGVELTFEASSSPVIFAKSRKDITDDVIKVYDEKNPGK